MSVRAMSLRGFLSGFLAELYQEHPDLPTPEARAKIRTYLKGHPDAQDQIWDWLDAAGGAAWTSYCGDQRREAERMLRQATVERTPLGTVIRIWEQQRLPLSDPHHAPLVRNCTLRLLIEADEYLAHYEASFAMQRQRLTTLIEQMGVAVDTTGNADLEVHEAESLGFVDWEAFADM